MQRHRLLDILVHVLLRGPSPPLIAATLHFFFFLIRRPPTPPLFPYTTLFRSIHYFFLPSFHERLADPPADVVERLVPGDRKSTRLNSSHVKISYAVFCLKKKKKYITVLVEYKQILGLMLVE